MRRAGLRASIRKVVPARREKHFDGIATEFNYYEPPTDPLDNLSLFALV